MPDSAVGVVRRSAGLWGPFAFAAASMIGARLQPDYRARTHHVSGLAARHTRSAAVMIPGFVALSAATLVLEHEDPTIRRVLRVAGITTFAAGVFRCSSPDCPDPLSDPAATPGDAAHSAASIATFALWVALPALDARHTPAGSHRDLCRRLTVTTAAGMIGAGVTTRLGSTGKGAVQRLFLTSALAWFVATSLRTLRRHRRP